MKKVKFKKKLVLNKETIANLNNSGMNDIKGRGSMTCNCPTLNCSGTGDRTCDICTILPLNEQTWCGNQPCN